jgi:hypothetical protein
MIRHPLLMAVLMGDLISLLLLLSAAKTALKTVTEWAPQSASGQQIRLERSVEAGELTAKFALAAFLSSTLLLLAGITNVLPAVIPGAMCGTGVLQATRGLMGSALFCRFLTLGILYLWLVLEKLNSLQPDGPLVVGSARILLLAVPFHVLAVATTLQAVWQMDAHQPVDCCAVVYDQFQSLAMARQTAGIPNSLWLLAFWTLSILLLLSGLLALRARASGRVKISGWTALLALLWVPTAALVLTRVFAAYYYQVLYHHCPWCLFLSDHKFVGIPLFFSLAVVVLEGPAAFASAKIAAKYTQFDLAAARRSKIAALRAVLAAGAFIGMVSLPAVFWRIQYGVWIH